jgi:hypothetical protein
MKQLSRPQKNSPADSLIHQPWRWHATALAAATILSVASSALAQTYYLNNSSSILTLSGAALGGTYSGQGANPLALVDNWGGTITLTSTMTPGNYTFVGSITGDLNPRSPFLPAAGGTPPVLGGTDNYGAYTLAYGVYPLYVAYRDMTVSITGGNAVQGGTAPATGMTLGFTAAHLDFDATPAVANYRGTVPLSSWTSPSGANTSSGNVVLSPDGSTLTVPVIFTTTSYGAGGVTETWTGQLVAVIPEPSSVALVGLGLGAFAAWNIRRGKRSL